MFFSPIIFLLACFLLIQISKAVDLKTKYNVTCPIGYQALAYFSGKINASDYPENCRFYEKPGCVQDCYWARGCHNPTVMRNGTYWENMKAVYINSIFVDLTSDPQQFQVYCCISGQYTVTNCKSVHVASLMHSMPYDIKNLVETKPVVRSFGDHFLNPPAYDYSLQVCESRKTVDLDTCNKCCLLENGRSACYSKVNAERNLTWHSARNSCASVTGGDLVSVHSRKEFQCFSAVVKETNMEVVEKVMKSLMKNHMNLTIESHHRPEQYWIGYRYSSQWIGANGWIWSDGTDSDYPEIWLENSKDPSEPQLSEPGSCAYALVESADLKTRECDFSEELSVGICQFELEDYKKCKEEGKCLD